MPSKTLFLISFLILGTVAQAQTRYFTKTGIIKFTAGTAVEDVDAVNKSVASVFDVSNGEIEFAVLIKGFEFKRGLMQEHFNENYLESEKFPKSTFNGKFEVSKIDFKKDGSYPTTAKGILEIHNEKKEVEIPGLIKVTRGIVTLSSEFKIQLVDYKIEIPGAVKDKISPSVEIHFTGNYKSL